MQSFGERFQAGQFHDLGALQGGKAAAAGPCGSASYRTPASPGLLLAATLPPDGRLVTLHLDGHRLDFLPRPTRQEPGPTLGVLQARQHEGRNYTGVHSIARGGLGRTGVLENMTRLGWALPYVLDCTQLGSLRMSTRLITVEVASGGKTLPPRGRRPAANTPMNRRRFPTGAISTLGTKTSTPTRQPRQRDPSTPARWDSPSHGAGFHGPQDGEPTKVEWLGYHLS